MDTLCHYTSIYSLKQIVTPCEIDFLAIFYKDNDVDDYKWIREKGKTIVREICEEHGWTFDSGHLAYDPFIISFSTNPNSYHMWEKFKGSGCEVMISFNPELFQYVISICNLESFVPCEYVRNDASGDEIKTAVMQIKDSGLLPNIEDEDMLKLAIMGVIQGKFYEEVEIRYVKLCPIYATVSPTDNGPQLELYEVPQEKYKEHVRFPKGLINQVVLRKDVCDDDFEEVKEHMVKCGYSPDIVVRQN